ncbi:MAG: 30S ribosomal protein S6 [Myxococcota bacterium]
MTAPTGRNALREYETTFIVQPEISEVGNASLLTTLDGILSSGGAIRLMCEDHGKRKLSYEVNKVHKGHYYTLMFLDGGQVVPALERSLRLDESVLRFLTILVEDEVADVEARKLSSTEAEVEQTKRAAERAAREAEETEARRQAEETAALEEARAKAQQAEADAQQADAPAEEADAKGDDTEAKGDDTEAKSDDPDTKGDDAGDEASESAAAEGEQS